MRYRIYAKGWGEIEMKKGTSTMIYKDALTQTGKEGVAKLLHKRSDRKVNGCTLEVWEVRFIKSNSRVVRNVKDDKTK
jgi:hypothetical protein